MFGSDPRKAACARQRLLASDFAHLFGSTCLTQFCGASTKQTLSLPDKKRRLEVFENPNILFGQKTNHKIISASGILVHAPSLAPRTQIQSRHFFSVEILYLSVRSGCTNEASGLMPFFFPTSWSSVYLFPVGDKFPAADVVFP